jgi:hypothetical protein
MLMKAAASTHEAITMRGLKIQSKRRAGEELQKRFDQGAGVASTHYYKALARSWSWSCIHTLFERESEN